MLDVSVSVYNADVDDSNAYVELESVPNVKVPSFIRLFIFTRILKI